jgi:hypothetical protein
MRPLAEKPLGSSVFTDCSAVSLARGDSGRDTCGLMEVDTEAFASSPTLDVDRFDASLGAGPGNEVYSDG